jgi:hypothetical protein
MGFSDMRRLVSFAFLLWASLAQAQVPAPAQQTPSRLDAAQGVASAVGAINTAETATITVPAGLYAYITAIAIEVCTNATGTVASVATFTSTNLNGNPTWLYSITATAQICYRTFESFTAAPLKSAASGTNVTIASPAGQTNNGFGIRAYYFLAP